VEAVEIVLSLWCAIALSIVLFSLRAMDRKAMARAERTHQALGGALVRADGAASPDARAAGSAACREEEAIVDVDFSADAPYDANRERWLQHVMRGPASRSPGSNEHRGLQRLRLVRPLPPELPVVDSAREDDTPAAAAQREPILPPPSAPPLSLSRR
jgi:hypothetical protein